MEYAVTQTDSNYTIFNKFFCFVIQLTDKESDLMSKLDGKLVR